MPMQSQKSLRNFDILAHKNNSSLKCDNLSCDIIKNNNIHQYCFNNIIKKLITILLMIIMNIIVLIIFKIKYYICSKSNSGKIIKKFDYLIQLLALRPKQAGMGLGCAPGY